MEDRKRRRKEKTGRKLTGDPRRAAGKEKSEGEGGGLLGQKGIGEFRAAAGSRTERKKGGFFLLRGKRKSGRRERTSSRRGQLGGFEGKVAEKRHKERRKEGTGGALLYFSFR